ncbi:MAG: hypothetical protein V1872_04425 [bacterium]
MEKQGNIVAVSGGVVDVRFDTQFLPMIRELLYTQTYHGEEIVLEVIEHRDNNICRCISFNPLYGLQRNAKCIAKGDTLSIPQVDNLFGRMINVLGRPIDHKGPIDPGKTYSVYNQDKEESPTISIKKGKGLNFDILETGIKLIDLFFPLIKGSKTGIMGGAALGKSLLILEIIHNIITKQENAACVFIGVGERIREGNDLYEEFVRTGLLKKSILAFGQMNESSGARFEIAHTGIAIAESLLQQGRETIFFYG